MDFLYTNIADRIVKRPADVPISAHGTDSLEMSSQVATSARYFPDMGLVFMIRPEDSTIGCRTFWGSCSVS